MQGSVFSTGPCRQFSRQLGQGVVLDAASQSNQPSGYIVKRIVICLITVALSWTAAAAELSRISVKGNQFVAADGKPIVFRAIDTSDPDKLQRNDQWNKRYFDEMKAWGANIVRFPVHPSAWRIHGKENYIKLLDQGVAWARELDLYVIIDWHSIGNIEAQKFLPGGSELYPVKIYETTKKETLDFWRTMSKHYGGNNTVAFFELFNEPVVGGKMGDCTWAQWKEFMEEVIVEIRKNGGTAVPLVAGFDYAYDLKPVAADPIKAEGIGYVSHPYPMKVKQPWEEPWTRDWGFVAEKYPLFLTEFGFLTPEEPGGYNPIIGDETYGKALMDYCAKRGISYGVWVFDPHWTPQMIKDWEFTPTRQGAFFKKVMQASQKNPAVASTPEKAGGQ